MLSVIGNSTIKRNPTKFPDIKDLDYTFDEVYKQLNDVVSKAKSHSFTFFAAETSGGTATKQITIEFNSYGIIKKFEIV